MVDLNFETHLKNAWEMIKRNWTTMLAKDLIVIIGIGIIFATMLFVGILHINLLTVIIYTMACCLILLLAYSDMKFTVNLFMNNAELNVLNFLQIPDRKFFRFVLVIILYSLIVYVGTIFFIIPGIYFAYKYMFAAILVIDKDMGVVEAMNASSQMAKGIKLNLLLNDILLGLLVMLITVAGLLCFVIGIIPAIFIAGWLESFILLSIYKELANKRLLDQNNN